eukprot:361013-Chlamydomonas_euryale.AAC.1
MTRPVGRGSARRRGASVCGRVRAGMRLCTLTWRVCVWPGSGRHAAVHADVARLHVARLGRHAAVHADVLLRIPPLDRHRCSPLPGLKPRPPVSRRCSPLPGPTPGATSVAWVLPLPGPAPRAVVRSAASA